jgi:hypothetical protein
MEFIINDKISLRTILRIVKQKEDDTNENTTKSKVDDSSAGSF